MATYFRKHSTNLAKRILVQKSRDLSLKERLNRHLTTTLQLEKKVAFNLSDIGEGIREVTVKEWYVKVGDTVEQFDNLCEVQSDKASVTITSRYDGKITKLFHTVDEIALVGKPLLEFDVADEDEGTSSSSSSDDDATTVTIVESAHAPTKPKVLTTPAVRRIAMENKVDLSKVPATGRQGRVLKGDVLEYLNLVPAGTNKPHPTLVEAVPIVPKQTVADRVEQLKGVRKIMFKSMTESLKIPHFAYSDEVNMTNLVNLRAALKDEAVERGVKLTYMPFLIKAASLALLKFPILNSSLDVTNESVIYKAAHNISVAMATPEGLVVPNVKNCEIKSVFQIAVDLNQLQERAQKGQLRPEDFANGTFSLSNIGIIGGTYTHPCIMPPQVAIGAMGKTKIVPRFGNNDEIVKAHIMSVSWSADHRVIDGVTMASFSEIWKKYLENPTLFVLDGH
ncbi:Lipoamide acyltransferase component of branched-chain alpha-keto acid dehydrogenase complex, mitochondrial [Pseudolycoriella hygida]|uniref:Dihydrolipoamide acetyltransferase component of pyruvate dehydrogenase complex n=1 Tax=Pseudolycoriella hygida TaxID=35572 RepID=A0A9Q0RZX5_9DIPT|nr:Lipoamide acyltransferase component of branched-chain alpha-keto acid dehydrogenase complex, mitochondrial [Pseudolycoriella hygida]